MLDLRGEVLAGKKVIGCCWVFANKYNVERQIVCQKTWLVAKRYSQVLGEDYNETYAAVVHLKSLQISIAVAAMLGLEIWQVDFVLAYLNSVPDFQVYIDMPSSLSGGEGKKVVLLKTLYSLMQGGRDWFWTLDKAYKDLGYHTSRADPCV